MAFLIISGVSYAQTADIPLLISFQGRLTDTSNNPLGGTHNFIFRIYNVPTGGSPLWTETQNGVPVDNGVLSVELGSVVSLSTAVFSSDTAYLDITVDAAVLTPRERPAISMFGVILTRLASTVW